eukprot:3707239-Rhodomonas_salina.1
MDISIGNRDEFLKRIASRFAEVSNTYENLIRVEGVPYRVHMEDVDLDPQFWDTGGGAYTHMIMWKYPSTSTVKDIRWWKSVTGVDFQQGEEYVGFLNDPLSLKWGDKVGSVGAEMYIVRVDLSRVRTVEDESQQFPVLPISSDFNRKWDPVAHAEDDLVCICGGIARTRLFQDALGHSKSFAFMLPNGNSIDVQYCAARNVYVDVQWKIMKAGTVGYKLLNGTQICVKKRSLGSCVRLVASL